jgi:hypothetical protein
MTAASGALALAAVVPAAASSYSRIVLGCTAANGQTVQGSTCVLPFGVTTAPNSYSTTLLVSGGNSGNTFTLAAGNLPPGLSLAAGPSQNTIISGNPSQTGTFNFTVRVRAAFGPTATRAYQITVTVQGPPDSLLCDPGIPSAFLINGACVLPDAVSGQPYQATLPTSHHAGGTVSVAAGTLPAGLSLPASFGPPGDTITGTAAPPGIQPVSTFTVQGTGDQGQPLYQTYQIAVDPDQPLAVVPPASGPTLFPGQVGQPFALGFALSGGAAPYTWNVAAGQLPPGLTLQTQQDNPRDANSTLAGTPATAGTYTFTLRVTDYRGDQATQQFTLTIQP